MLAELDGLNVGNAYGEVPLVDHDPTKWNEAYFQHVDWIVQEANKRGLYIAMLPTWGDRWQQASSRIAGQNHQWTPPTTGPDQDWVLVVE